MNILEIETFSVEILTIVDFWRFPEWTDYRRYGPQVWEILMGGSWEEIGPTICEELEMEYQKFKGCPRDG